MSAVVCCLVALGTLSSSDSPGPRPEPLHPRDYRSDDGAWVLHVDSSQRYGAGPARYRMTHDGELVWEREHEFTFKAARVASDGTAAGWGHTESWLARSEGDLFFAIVGGDGAVRAVERQPLELGRLGLRPTPQCLEFCEETDRAALHVVDPDRPRSSEFWCYVLSTGRALGRSADRPELRYACRQAALPAQLPRVDSPPPPAPFALESIAELSRTALGTVRFERTPAACEESSAQRGLGFLHLDDVGRLWFHDGDVSVLAFDRSGVELLVARLDPDDLGKGFASRLPRWAFVREDGHLLVRVYEGLVEFTSDGRRVGRSGEPDWGAPRVILRRRHGDRWELDEYDGRIRLVDAFGNDVRTIERGASDRWLRKLRNPVASSDGGLAVLDEAYGDWRDVWQHLFDAEGDPISSIQIPPLHSLAYDGRRVALLRDRVVVLLDTQGAVQGKLTLSELSDPYAILFSPEGELWVLDGGVLHRYRVP